jgi:hypothetical protein
VVVPVDNGGKVGTGVFVTAGVLVGATIAVKVRPEANVDTAEVWIWSTATVGVPSGTFPPPHEAIKIAPSANNICTFINRVLSIYTPFHKSRYFTWNLTLDYNTNIPQISYGLVSRGYNASHDLFRLFRHNTG